MTRYIFATFASIAISFFAHKVIAIPDLYFIFGAIDAFCVMAILQVQS